ncbi:MAG: ThuA domain-containing protein, partial [Clostridiales bacterium]|nr:ThuA domain-containing protein [Clostridiales bacterium]
TDVLIYWAHVGHAEITYEEANRVKEAVLKGMGIIFLHSAHASRPFSMLLGTSGSLSWREDGDKTRLWILSPEHPILKGINKPFIELEHEETYSERFDIPAPDDLLTITWYEGGEVFRSGCCWKRGLGKIFYFQPGHETNLSFQNKYVQRIIKNAVRWACPVKKNLEISCPHFMALED